MDEAPQYVIEMLHITKEFPGIKANDDITLQLRRGEIHALLGENGSGKTNIFEIPPEKMTAYTNIIIRNISVNMLRLRNREPLYEDNMNETEEIAFEDDVISQVSRNELVEFILKLPKGQRDALYAKIVLGASSAAGAEILNISETAFRQRIYAAKQSIKVFLEGEK